MSQRRGPKDNVINPAELVPFSESLDKDPKAGMTMDRDSAVVVQPLETTTTAPLDKRYEKEAHNLRIKQWKEGPFACGFTEASWDEEYAKYKNHPREVCAAMVDNDETSPCGCCSAIACRMIGANRVGNMSIVKQSTEWVEEEQEDEHGELKTRRFTRPRLDIVVGPYWPMLCCVTYPLILGVSLMTLITAIPGKHPLIILFWAACTLGLIYSLAMTAFRDPGILPRYENPPADTAENSGWRWSDRAHSYRPRGAFYDPDTAVVVEGFDHTCTWIGGPIGRKNAFWFKMFLFFLYSCLIMDTYWLGCWWKRGY